MIKIEWSSNAKKDLKKLVKENKDFVIKLNHLLKDMEKHPYTGIGKPEKLKYVQGNIYSRRISKKHRVVYEVIEPDLIIISCFGHYI